MGLNVRGKMLICETEMHRCKACQVAYGLEAVFCPECGQKLVKEKTQVYANYGKKGVSSVSFVLPDGLTINSKGKISKKLAKGISYTNTVKDS